MLRRLGRRFYSAKYVFSVHLHSVSPWFAHDKPVKVVWKRGAKKHKRGETSTKMPTPVGNGNVHAGALTIEEGFELGVTLYAGSNKTKKTGPYGQKDLKMVIMEVDDDGSIYSILGALTINLNDYVGGLDHRIKVPVECDNEIVNAVGQPHIDITVRSHHLNVRLCVELYRSWYKQGGTASASSGMSSTGWSEHHGSDSDEPEIVITSGDTHLDPVKPLDVLDPRKSLGALPIDSVPEHTVQVDGTTRPAALESRVVTNSETDDVISTSPAKDESTPELTAIETEKNNVHDSALMEEEAIDTPPAMMESLPESHDHGLPNAADLITVGFRHQRLSTINSEAGEEVADFMDSNEDALKEFIRNELGEDEMVGIPEVIMADHSKDDDDEKTTPIEEHVHVETQETEAEMPKGTSIASSEIQEPEPIVVKDEVKEMPSTQVTEPAFVSTAPIATAPMTESRSIVETKPKSDEKPMSDPMRQRRSQTKPPQKPSRRCLFWWLPGSSLVCCQPVVPREP